MKFFTIVLKPVEDLAVGAEPGQIIRVFLSDRQS